jgi:hypothetical protein
MSAAFSESSRQDVALQLIRKLESQGEFHSSSELNRDLMVSMATLAGELASELVTDESIPVLKFASIYAMYSRVRAKVRALEMSLSTRADYWARGYTSTSRDSEFLALIERGLSELESQIETQRYPVSQQTLFDEQVKNPTGGYPGDSPNG